MNFNNIITALDTDEHIAYLKSHGITDDIIDRFRKGLKDSAFKAKVAEITAQIFHASVNKKHNTIKQRK